MLRLVRSPHHRARFRVGDLGPVLERHPGLVRILTAADVPGRNGFGIYPDLKDQPVLAVDEVRHRGDPVLALVGEPAAVAAVRDEELPVEWEPLPPVRGIDAALSPGAPAIHAFRPDNVLIRGRVVSGDAEGELAGSAVTAAVEVETGFVEHAYIEPEAGLRRAQGATGSRSSAPPRRPTWTGTRWRPCSASRRSGCGSSPRPAAAGSAASSTRCSSRCWRWRPG